jgi:hypothetical protein
LREVLRTGKEFYRGYNEVIVLVLRTFKCRDECGLSIYEL